MFKSGLISQAIKLLVYYYYPDYDIMSHYIQYILDIIIYEDIHLKQFCIKQNHNILNCNCKLQFSGNNNHVRNIVM